MNRITHQPLRLIHKFQQTSVNLLGAELLYPWCGLPPLCWFAVYRSECTIPFSTKLNPKLLKSSVWQGTGSVRGCSIWAILITIKIKIITTSHSFMFYIFDLTWNEQSICHDVSNYNQWLAGDNFLQLIFLLPAKLKIDLFHALSPYWHHCYNSSCYFVKHAGKSNIIQYKRRQANIKIIKKGFVLLERCL